MNFTISLRLGAYSTTPVPSIRLRVITGYSQKYGDSITSSSLGLQLKNVIEKSVYGGEMSVFQQQGWSVGFATAYRYERCRQENQREDGNFAHLVAVNFRGLGDGEV